MSIAYGVSGEGLPIVVGPIPFSHVQLTWDHHPAAELLRALASRFRVIQFDARGFGLSSRELGPEHCLEDYVVDLEAVVNSLGVERFVSFTGGFGADVAACFAARHPERVVALLVCSASVIRAEWRDRALYEAMAIEDWDMFLTLVAGRGQSVEESKKRVERYKEALTLDGHISLMKAIAAFEKREETWAGLVRPMLLMHPRDYHMVSQREALELARLSRAHFVLLDGGTAYGDSAQTLEAIETFLSELPASVWEFEQQGLPAGLSPRELEVLRLVASGKSNAQIADALVLSVHTVARHIANILDKTGTANRTEAAAFAQAHDLILNVNEPNNRF
jgi:DNA-binding CsgD family transcriptional regulator/pimeloyl-ACP methyl ester carboxylesterase